MPFALHHIDQLPQYRNQLARQREVLTVATGFTDEDRADLIAIYDTLLAKADEIINQPTPTHTI
jgi:hypothetical protein